jgi:tetratricopeptide (TPR) repeat protein
LARTYEERGETEFAAAEYCRYLSLSPAASDSEDVQQRVRDLASRSGDRDELSAAVRAGFESFQVGRFDAAVLAFGRVLELRPTWASAYFNRGLTWQMLGRQEEAVADLQRYLELRPQAEDRQAVLAQIQTLHSSLLAPGRSPSPLPANVLLQGLFVPGLGQVATGRPVSGILVFTAAAGAAYIALRKSPVVGTRIGFDPFGNPYEFQDRTLERKHLVAGAVAGVGVVVAAALEAYVYARAKHSPRLPQLRAEEASRTHLKVKVEAGPRLHDPAIVLRLSY